MQLEVVHLAAAVVFLVRSCFFLLVLTLLVHLRGLVITVIILFIHLNADILSDEESFVLLPSRTSFPLLFGSWLFGPQLGL
jgi:hypothetical protein